MVRHFQLRRAFAPVSAFASLLLLSQSLVLADHGGPNLVTVTITSYFPLGACYDSCDNDFGVFPATTAHQRPAHSSTELPYVHQHDNSDTQDNGAHAKQNSKLGHGAAENIVGEDSSVDCPDQRCITAEIVRPLNNDDDKMTVDGEYPGETNCQQLECLPAGTPGSHPGEGESFPGLPGRVDGFELLGCYASSTNFPTFRNTASSEKMDLEFCASRCQSAFFGVYSTDCYCAEKTESSVTQVDKTLCSTPCPGDETEFCGGRVDSALARRQDAPSDILLSLYAMAQDRQDNNPSRGDGAGFMTSDFSPNGAGTGAVTFSSDDSTPMEANDGPAPTGDSNNSSPLTVTMGDTRIEGEAIEGAPLPQQTGSQTRIDSSDGVTATTTNSAPTESSTPNEYIDTILRQHNLHRSNHSAPALTWNPTIAGYAEELAETCNFAHDTTIGGGGYGQNLAAYCASNIDDDAPYWAAVGVTNQWYNKEFPSFKDYGAASPSRFSTWGHFSQIVWHGTSQVGCASTKCPSSTISETLPCWYLVCNYNPPGNLAGTYDDNVSSPLGQPVLRI